MINGCIVLLANSHYPQITVHRHLIPGMDQGCCIRHPGDTGYAVFLGVANDPDPASCNLLRVVALPPKSFESRLISDNRHVVFISDMQFHDFLETADQVIAPYRNNDNCSRG